MSWLFMVLNIVGFLCSTDLANNAKNWPTQVLWALMALMCVGAFVINFANATT